MGERQSDGGLTGRRRAHPAHPGDAAPATGVEAVLAAALRADHVDADAERRVVHAFVAARDAGAHRARTRRRDDWRPHRGRAPRRSLRTVLSVLLAGFTLGGVALAAIGGTDPAARGSGTERRPGGPVADGSRQPYDGPSASVSPSVSGTPDRPDTARDTEAHCRAYEKVEGRGKALGATAWQRLVDAAGGEENVGAYCARTAAGATPRTAPGGPDTPEAPGTPDDVPAATPVVPAPPTKAPAYPTSALTAIPDASVTGAVPNDVTGNTDSRPDAGTPNGRED